MSRSACLALAALALVVPAAAAQPGPADLRLATLEELMAIEVTSASRRERRAEDVPAAVYVIDRHQIRRSGLTSIPEIRSHAEFLGHGSNVQATLVPRTRAAARSAS